MKKESSRKKTVFFLLSILICIIYSNSIHSSWNFDDEPNILLNPHLHLTDLKFSSLAYTLISGSSWDDNPKLYRPIPSLTFALNWYFGQDNTLGYHVVNIIIHIATSFFLFLVIQQILKRIDIQGFDDDSKYFVALLASSLWAVAPIQTQAVTYIVQRMASMAAMFTILAIYSYCKGRTAPTKNKQYQWFFLCILFFFAGLASKENSILIPVSLFLVEICFFSTRITKKTIISIFIIGTGIIFSGFLFVHFGLGKTPFSLSNPLQFLESYSHRSFTFTERILTQPRIVLMYLSQIFLPRVNSLSIAHDIEVSTSFIYPWTTLPSILIIFLLLSLFLYFIKKYPLFSFPVLFFFANHAVESTILQLELVYEHRNYLPSFFLFLPISFLIAKALYSSSVLSSFGRYSVIIGTIFFLIISGHATYTRNFAWATEETLWEDAIKKAPLNPRASYFLGRWHKEYGEHEIAWNYYQHTLAHFERSPNPKSTKIAALSALGSIPYQLGMYQEALPYLDRCFELDENNSDNLKNRAMTYLHLGLPQKALHDAELLLDKYPSSPLFQYTAALAAYHSKELEKAQMYMGKAIDKSIDKPYALHLMGLILLEYKSYPNSLFFLNLTNKLSPHTIDYQITLAAAYHAAQEAALTEAVLRDIVNRYPLPRIRNALQKTQIKSGTVSFMSSRIDSMIQAISHETP